MLQQAQQSNHQPGVVNSEIRALLMLLLLKGGTRAEEIQTALQMAAISRMTAQEPEEDEEFAATPEAPAPVQSARTEHAPVRAPRQFSPKQVVRNSYLAPIKGYAA